MTPPVKAGGVKILEARAVYEIFELVLLFVMFWLLISIKYKKQETPKVEVISVKEAPDDSGAAVHSELLVLETQYINGTIYVKVEEL